MEWQKPQMPDLFFQPQPARVYDWVHASSLPLKTSV
jgi:hypothetical protein